MAFYRLPLLALGILCLLTAVWGALVRLTWHLPLPQYNWLSYHGPLMVCGFLGTVIGLERAVGLAKIWAYAAPLGSGAGAIVVISGSLSRLGPFLVTLGSLAFLAIFAFVYRLQPERHNAVMGVGASAWVVGNVLWLMGRPINTSVLWWAAFLILTIAGERLQLTRFLKPRPGAWVLFVLASALLGVGVVVSPVRVAIGARLAGAGLLALGLWLLVNDIARRNLAQKELTRFMAWALLMGYVWLCVSGALALAYGLPEYGMRYDAILHTLFVGFVFSMIFGHAPVIFPAILGVTMLFRPRYYVPLVLLHASLAVRVAGDLSGSTPVRMWGGLFNVVAILVFLLNTVSSIRRAGPSPEAEA